VGGGGGGGRGGVLLDDMFLPKKIDVHTHTHIKRKHLPKV